MSHSTLMKYSTVMKLRTEADLPAAIAAAAEKHRTKPSEWMRRKLREALQADGMALPPGDDPGPSNFPPAPAQRVAA